MSGGDSAGPRHERRAAQQVVHQAHVSVAERRGEERIISCVARLTKVLLHAIDRSTRLGINQRHLPGP